MALENSNGGFDVSMPVAPAYGMPYGGNYNNSGFLGNGGDWLILFLFAMMFGGGWGMGGFGGFGGWGMANGMWGGYGIDYLYPWLNNSEHISNGFQTQQLNTQISGLQNAVTSGFSDVQLGIAGVNQGISAGTAAIQNSLCGGFAGVNAAVNGAQNAITQQMYANQISDLERSFAAQTANTTGLTAIQGQLAQNGYNQASSTADVKYTLATEACNTRAVDTQNTNTLLTALNNGIQGIKDQLCADKIEAKNDTIAQLRSELLYARGQASQDVQTAAIQLGQRNLANEIESYVAPKAVPAYIVANPNGCGNYNTCGCGCGSY